MIDFESVKSGYALEVMLARHQTSRGGKREKSCSSQVDDVSDQACCHPWKISGVKADDKAEKDPRDDDDDGEPGSSFEGLG